MQGPSFGYTPAHVYTLYAIMSCGTVPHMDLVVPVSHGSTANGYLLLTINSI